MDFIETAASLEALYGTPSKGPQVKVAYKLTPTYRQWIMASKFCILSTVGPDGTDGTPRGDDGPVVTELDTRTLAMLGWNGNNRIDSLRNIGDILKEMTLGEFDGTTYDIEWPKQAQTTMW